MEHISMELVFVLDRSGSMSGLESDTIGGFNSLIHKQKESTEGTVLVTTVLFDDKRIVVHDHVNLKEVKSMTSDDYYVGGCTALLDAIGITVSHVWKKQKELPKEMRPDKTMVIITTDGMENSSVEYTFDKVSQLVTKQQKKHDWEFLFLGANMDAVATASNIGIRKERATNYVYDAGGVEICYQTVSNVVSGVRSCKSRLEREAMMDECLEPIQSDFEKRGKK